MKKFKLEAYHKNPDYIEYLEECRRICNQIYLFRNITLDEKGILETLKEIDRLPSHKCFGDKHGN